MYKIRAIFEVMDRIECPSEADCFEWPSFVPLLLGWAFLSGPRIKRKIAQVYHPCNVALYLDAK